MNQKWLESQFSLSGSNALVTGASKGIGFEIATALASAGADLILVGRELDSLQKCASHCKEQNVKVSIELCDLSDQSSLSAVLERISQSKIDILVNNAGTIHRQAAVDVKTEDWKRIIDVNLDSVFKLTQHVGRRMIKNGKGRIINIASLLSFQGGINVAPYTVSKHGILGLTRALANEWGPLGVNVNAIAPGYISTDNTLALRNDKERSEAILSRIPLGRWGKPEDISAVAVFLASQAAQFINGEVITVDGGWMSR